MFDWWKRNKPPPSAHDDDIPSPIRKPQHAYRDARMSIPIGEREFYDVIQARKRSSLASSVSNGKWKGKGRLDSGVPSTTASSDWASHNSSSYGSKTSLTGGWTVAVAEEYGNGRRSELNRTGTNSLAESSWDAVAREREGTAEE